MSALSEYEREGFADDAGCLCSSHLVGLGLRSADADRVVAMFDRLAAAVREAEQRALREAADEIGWRGDRSPRDWLHDRADRVAEPQHEAATSGKESEASDE